MIIEKQVTINKGVEDAWHVLGHEFENAYQWASVLKHSESKGGSLNGSSCSIRGCDVSGMGKVTEKLLHYSNEDHSLSYHVVEGMPSMVKSATNSWTLKPIDTTHSILTMSMSMEIGGFMGFFMKPMMKMMMDKMAKVTIDDFKYYVENGKPSEAKVKAVRK